jgi:hypothetical protein
MQHKSNTVNLSVWRKDVQSVLVCQCLLLVNLVLLAAIFSGYLSALNVLFSGLSIFIPSLILGVWLCYKTLKSGFNSNVMLVALLLKAVLSGLCLAGSLVVLKDLGWVWQGFFVGLVFTVLAPMLYGVYRGFKT